MNKDEIQKKIAEEDDYIRCPKAGNSLTKFVTKNSEGVEDATIARVLMIPEEKVETIYQEAVVMLREKMEDDE